jgi:SAM-dependent methyltransferase
MASIPSTAARFAHTVDRYARFRPRYPATPLLAALARSLPGFSSSSVVADIGCGTGLSSSVFLGNGNRVLGIEPNQDMLRTAVSELASHHNFEPVWGATAESTTLPDSSVDLVSAGQSAHWFDPQRFNAECRRILKPQSPSMAKYVLIFWNDHESPTNQSEFTREYNAICHKTGDYLKITAMNRCDSIVRTIQRPVGFGSMQPSSTSAALSFHTESLNNDQRMTLEGLKGRFFSSSWAPREETQDGAAVGRELERLFEKHKESDGLVNLQYDLRLFIISL